MAGRTSEKGNITGKTIFCFIGKVIGAGITAFWKVSGSQGQAA